MCQLQRVLVGRQEGGKVARNRISKPQPCCSPPTMAAWSKETGAVTAASEGTKRRAGGVAVAKGNPWGGDSGGAGPGRASRWGARLSARQRGTTCQVVPSATCRRTAPKGKFYNKFGDWNAAEARFSLSFSQSCCLPPNVESKGS